MTRVVSRGQERPLLPGCPVGAGVERLAEERMLKKLSFLCVIAVGLFVAGTATLELFQVSAAFCLDHSIHS